MKLRNLRVPFLVCALGLTAALLIAGCAALDKAAPDFAGHPAVPATTQPSPTNPNITINIPAQPATQSNVPAQIGEILEKVSTNPAVEAGASAVPYGNLATGIAQLLGGALIFFAGRKTGQSSAPANTLMDSLQAATDTSSHQDAAAAAHAAIAASNDAPTSPPNVGK